MKIAFFSDTAFPQINGISRSISNFFDILIKKNKLILFTYKGANKIKNVGVNGYKTVDFFRYGDYYLVIPNEKEIFRKLKEFQPDIIHIHTPTPLGYSAISYGKKFKIPVVGTYHTYLSEFVKYFPIPILNKTKLMKKIAWIYSNWFYHKIDLVVVPNEIIKDELIKNGFKKKIVVISNGVDLNKFYVKKISDKYKCDLLHVGRIGYEKRVDILLKAFSLVKGNYKFFIIGDGPELENLKKNCNDERVKFLGKKFGLELLNYYNGCKAFVTASPIETEGIVLLEAMACGKPIIGVNKLAVPKVVKKNYNGCVAESGDYEKISEYMKKLLENKKLRGKLSKNSLKEAKKYSIEKSVEKLIKEYKKIIL